MPSQRLQDEKSHLRSLPADNYVPLVTLGRRVSRDGFVAYNGNEYSVPDGLKRLEVEVRATLEEVGLYQDGRLLASHPLLDGRGKCLLDPGHHRGSKQRSKNGPFRNIDDIVEVQCRPLEEYEEVLR